MRLPPPRIALALPAALLCWTIATPGHATTIEPHAAERTFATADAIVEGVVIGTRETVIDEGLPLTYYKIQVSDVLKGETGDYVELLLPGGWTEDGNYVHVHGRPLMQVGDAILVALSHMQVEGLDHRLAQMVMNEPPCQLCRASSIGASLAGRAEAFGSTVW